MNKKIKQPWFKRHPELLHDVEQAIKSYKWLRLIVEDNVTYVKGTLKVVNKRYKIEISFPVDYPENLPTLRETGGEIPKTPKRHVNPDGTACLCIPDAWFSVRPDASFSTFLEFPVRNFFISQQHYELYKKWPLGERNHGNVGKLDFYKDFLGTDDVEVIKKHLQCLTQKTIKGHWCCPCGSGKKLRDCHRDRLFALQEKVPHTIATQTYRELFPSKIKTRK